MSIFEIGMLVGFGAAWPFSIYRSWTSRTTRGKSLLFMVVIFFGYISGTLHKIFYNYDPVIYLYIMNGIMVAIDLILYFRNRRMDRSGQADSG